MTFNRRFISLGVAIVAALSTPHFATAQQPVGTAFTYQGQLKNGGQPVNGSANLRFEIWDAPTGGSDWGWLNLGSTPISNGLFTTSLDFGSSPFTSDEARWLQVVVDGVPLSPRQPLTAAPFSLATRGIRVDPSGNVAIGRDDADGGSLDVLGSVSNGAIISAYNTALGDDWTYGIWASAHSQLGVGIRGDATIGLLGTTAIAGGTGVWGEASGPYSRGGSFRSWGEGGQGVHGAAVASNGVNYGVVGETASPNGYGVYSFGNFAATGTKSFQIDHPLDPENKVLNHYCAEGPEPLNVYGGTITLDVAGEALVELPAYFAEINRDCRYQLTPVGAAMPNLHVAEEVSANHFRIAGGVPGTRVSWQVSAIRNDLWVRTMGAPVEVEKPNEQRGQFLSPALYGRSQDDAITGTRLATPRRAVPTESAHSEIDGR